MQVNGIDEIWAADLVDMQTFSRFNRGVKYLLAVIDIFSKYGWLVPLKDKSGKSVATAFKQIFKERKPTKIWVDKGKEFYNKDVKSLIELYSTENEEKSSVVERWNRTMKEKMWKYFSANSTSVYIDVLDDLVEQYNNTRHSSIKMTPVEASKKTNEIQVWRNMYPEHVEIKTHHARFSVGDKVRITKKKKTFEKGYTPRWTEEVFTISAVQNTSPVTYKIADLNGEEIQGTFYEAELQKTNQDVYRIEKVVKKGKTKSLVKWKELHKPVIQTFPKRRVQVNGIDEIWAADLVDMQTFSRFNRGVKYLLAVIDIFSKYGWLVPLKDKSGKSVATAFKQIFKERKPTKIWVDKGKEFYNKDVKSLIELYSTENEEKSSVVERWNRTMKEKMWKYFSANSTSVYIDVLDDLVEQYNNTRHSSIKMTPVEASKKTNEIQVWRNMYPEHVEIKTHHARFSVGDKVRITKKKKTFEKGYTPRWTEEVFTISAVQNTSPVTYKIADLNGEEIQGTFYEAELQKTNQDVYRIEKVVKKGKTKSLVKWKGYPASFNSWVSNQDLVSTSPRI